jgi:hypothetical protein
MTTEETGEVSKRGFNISTESYRHFVICFYLEGAYGLRTIPRHPIPCCFHLCRAIKRYSVLWRNLAVVRAVRSVVYVALSQAPYPSADTSEPLLARFWLRVMKPVRTFIYTKFTRRILTSLFLAI